MGKLFMFFFTVLLILVLLTGGKAFAASCEDEPSTGREVAPGITEYGECEMSASELAELERIENEQGEALVLEDEALAEVAEGAEGRVPAEVHGSGPAASSSPDHKTDTSGARSRNTRRSRGGCERCKRSGKDCRSGRHRTGHTKGSSCRKVRKHA